MVADVTSVKFDSRLSVFKLSDGSVLQDVSADVVEVSGLPGQTKINDGTTFGSEGERPLPSIKIAHFTVKFLFNRATTTGISGVLAGMYNTRDLRAFEYWPLGTDNVAKISGNAYIANYPITSRMGDIVMLTCEFHADNGVTVVA